MNSPHKLFEISGRVAASVFAVSSVCFVGVFAGDYATRYVIYALCVAVASMFYTVVMISIHPTGPALRIIDIVSWTSMLLFVLLGFRIVGSIMALTPISADTVSVTLAPFVLGMISFSFSDQIKRRGCES